jgi:hypothetical protein
MDCRQGVSKLVRQPERRPVIGRHDAQPAEVLRHDTDDRVRHAVDADIPADDGRIVREQPAPSAMTEHEHRPAGRRIVVGWHQRASARRLDAEHVEEVAGDESAPHWAAVDACSYVA